VKVVGPYGTTFLMPNHPGSSLLMVCTGTGSAPMRAMTERRRRRIAQKEGGELMLFFGARTPDELPYFGPLQKLPKEFIDINFAFSRVPERRNSTCRIAFANVPPMSARLIADANCHIYVCGLKDMEDGVEPRIPRRLPGARLGLGSVPSGAAGAGPLSRRNVTERSRDASASRPARQGAAARPGAIARDTPAATQPPLRPARREPARDRRHARSRRLVEAMHYTVSRTPGALASRARGAHARHHGTCLSERARRDAARGRRHRRDSRSSSSRLFAASAPSPKREALVAALNGVLGDYLAETGKSLGDSAAVPSPTAYRCRWSAMRWPRQCQ
jgi:hypothetical protein